MSPITTAELMLLTKEVVATTLRPLPPYLAAALVYWTLGLLFEAPQRRAAQRLNRAHR